MKSTKNILQKEIARKKAIMQKELKTLDKKRQQTLAKIKLLESIDKPSKELVNKIKEHKRSLHMKVSYITDRKPSAQRSALEERSKYKKRVSRGSYVSNAMAAKFGMH